MGQTDLMYSVFSANRFRNAVASEENIKEFYESGRLDTDALASELTGHELPAYIMGYEFSIKTYLSSMQEISGQELHVLLLSIVSGLLQTPNCTLVNTYRVPVCQTPTRSQCTTW